MRSKRVLHLLPIVLLTACQQKSTAPAVESPFILTASIQDLMTSEVDPSANVLWQAVSEVTGEKGTEQHQPRTDEEWAEVRQRAITLVEAANLLVMDGRRVAQAGKKLKDEGTPGVLGSAEIQKAIDTDRAGFVLLAHGLHDAADLTLKAIDAKDPMGLQEAGGVIDAACEACHTKYWYPGQDTSDLTK